jgi:arginine decarboxylase
LSKAIARHEVRTWTTRDSIELYNVSGWSNGFFEIGESGTVVVTPEGAGGRQIDLYELVETLQRRGLSMPILLRFSDILHSRVRALVTCFQNAIRDYEYKGRYRPIYPIKVNQQRQVVEELVNFGRPHDLGLEVGSKPELLAGLALLDNPNSLLILNGYKDIEYIETALLSQKLGRYPIVVIDRLKELDHVLKVAERLQIKPHIGVRAKLSVKGAGKWAESSGDRSKFGLTAAEMVQLLERLRQRKMLDCLELVHFHIGSQISTVRAIKEAMMEASRVYVELARQGAGLKFLDVGGGLGVDYDGSSTNWASSVNYTVQEYANDVVSEIQKACDAQKIPNPDIISESGRALVAHHSVLVFDVLDADTMVTASTPPSVEEVKGDFDVIQSLAETWRGITRKNFQESYHDALQLKETAAGLFNVGLIDLAGRARAEQLFWGCCEAIHKVIRDLDYVPDELEGLEKALADTYFCNFSVFQSAPDTWAVDQLFPTLPIHRLNERPTRRGVLVDLTCDSDGKLDRFIDLRDVKHSLELHPLNGKPYYLGMFLIGAYQEILGDLHNLFGDTHAVHVSLAENGYSIDHIQEGDTVTDVLGYVQFQRPDLMQRMRQAIEKALRDNLLSIEESALLMSRYAQGLGGYTYLEEKPTPEPGSETLTIVRTEPRANGGAKPRQTARGKTSA